MASHGHFHWNELMTKDTERAKRFYGGTIGWTFDAMPMGNGATYWIAKMGDQPVGGIFPTNQAGCETIPEGWMPYLAVDDIEARVKQAVEAGAKLMRAIFEVPGIGRIAILTEPGGAAVGWIQPA